MKRCKLCANNLRPLLTVEGFDYYICKRCGLIQMIPPKRKENVKDDYQKFGLENYLEFVKKFRYSQYKKDIETVKKYKKEGVLLDIGCGTGEFLEIAKSNGFIPYGVEPSFSAWLMAREKGEVLKDEWEKINFAEGSLDIITLWSVLEHMVDPIFSLKKIKIALKEDGIIAIRTPVSSGLLIKLSIILFRLSAGLIKYPVKTIFQIDYHYPHFYIFNLKNLRVIFEKVGFEILEFNFENSYDVKSIDSRIIDIKNSLIKIGSIKLALLLISTLSNLFKNKDEIVLVGRKI